MDWLQHKYIGILSSRLERFKRKSNTLYNFRCPICGDSETSKIKARAYIYDKQGSGLFHCHNCNKTLTLVNFIKEIDHNLYNEYQLEKLRDSRPKEMVDLQEFVNKMKKPVFMKAGPLKNLKKVSQLLPSDLLKQFVVNRKIPNEYHAKLFSCPNFMRFVNDLVPEKFSIGTTSKDETRLLIPFFDRDKNLHAFQGRSIGKSGIKYITIVLDDSTPKIFGLDTVDLNKTTYVLEGPIDSMFIPNSIATAGGDLVSVLKDFSKEKLVIVYDNEPRNKDTIKKIDKAIMQGYKVCIWPENLEHKDVNDMGLAGLSAEFIEYIIKQNTYKDLSAKMALTKWSKV